MTKKIIDFFNSILLLYSLTLRILPNNTEMRKYLTLIASVVFTIFLYFLYVVDNIFCAFGIGAKIPFKDFVELEFYHKYVYIRLFFVTLIIFVTWLMV